MGFLAGLFGGSRRTVNFSDPQHHYFLVSKIASLFDGFIIQAGANAFLCGRTAVVISREGDVFLSQFSQEKLAPTQPQGYALLSKLPSFASVRDEMSTDPESAMLTMMMDGLAKEALSALVRQAR
jgi:hypothetical protein